MTCAVERSPIMSAVDWRSQDWLDHEIAAIRRLAEKAGWAAYAGPAWSNRQIHDEAHRFLRHSLLLAPHQDDPLMQGIVFSRFLKGWRAHEAHEGRQP